MFIQEENEIAASAEDLQLEQVVLLAAIRRELEQIDPTSRGWWIERFGEWTTIVAYVDTPAGRLLGEIAQELGWDPIYKGRRL